MANHKIPEVKSIAWTDLRYYHKTQDEKQQYKQDILQKMLYIHQANAVSKSF